MTAFSFVTLDVFTERRFAGNPLAVVMDAQGLSTEQMQTVAREFSLSETSFVLPPRDPAHTARVRIFTPQAELPFAGHPTIGTAVSIAKERDLSGELQLELNSGLFTVQVESVGEKGRAEFQNPNLPCETGDAPESTVFEEALSLPKGSISVDHRRPRRLGAGADFYFLHASIEAVRSARVESGAWKPITTEGLVGVYVYSDGGEDKGIDFHARMFAPDVGIIEDPATGGAVAALPGKILLSEGLKDGAHEWLVEQGIEMGRPSQIRARVRVRDGDIESVRIGGEAVCVQRGQIYV